MKQPFDREAAYFAQFSGGDVHAPLVECPVCHGYGHWMHVGEHDMVNFSCGLCQTTGYVSGYVYQDFMEKHQLCPTCGRPMNREGHGTNR